MSTKIRLSFLAVIGLALAACSSPATPSSCNAMSGTVSFCIDYGTSVSASAAQSGCTMAGGTYAATACTTTNRVGRCAFTVDSVAQTANYYMPLTVDEARAACMATSASATFTEN